jgi:hypothetical protein
VIIDRRTLSCAWRRLSHLHRSYLSYKFQKRWIIQSLSLVNRHTHGNGDNWKAAEESKAEERVMSLLMRCGEVDRPLVLPCGDGVREMGGHT